MGNKKSASGNPQAVPASAGAPGQYVLRLYITGLTPRSIRATENIKRICEQYLGGRYDLEVIDLYQRPELAEAEQIVATPTFIKLQPPPMRRLIGDMSRTERVLLSLELPALERPRQAPGESRHAQ